MFTNNIALISEASQIAFEDVAKVAAALQKQITRDFTPLWNIPATIDAFKKLEDVPPGYWPIIIREDIGYPGAAGIHLDNNGQPYALVEADGNFALTCSHELLEMLADPFGNRLVASYSIKPGQGRAKYLVEVCDPSEAEAFSYTINGIIVSDFYTPHYFDPVAHRAVRYSYTGAIQKPREVLKGGYLSWMLPETNEWWQATYFGAQLSFRSLGVQSRSNGESWREKIDSLTFEPMRASVPTRALTALTLKGSLDDAGISQASSGWARLLTAEIDEKIKKSKKK